MNAQNDNKCELVGESGALTATWLRSLGGIPVRNAKKKLPGSKDPGSFKASVKGLFEPGSHHIRVGIHPFLGGGIGLHAALDVRCDGVLVRVGP